MAVPSRMWRYRECPECHAKKVRKAHAGWVCTKCWASFSDKLWFPLAWHDEDGEHVGLMEKSVAAYILEGGEHGPL